MVRKTTVCEICGRAIRNSNYQRHLNAHAKQKVDDGKYHVDHEGLDCKFCGKPCKNLNSLTQHERTCPQNPDRNYVNHSIGCTPWNKGLTKDTDDRVKRNAEAVSITLNNKVKLGWKPAFATEEFWTAEQRKYQSDKKIEFYRKHPEKHPNRILASNNFRTYPEQIVCTWLSDNKINFIEQYRTKFYNNTRFVDFYLPDYSLYIEVDGVYWHADCADIDYSKDEFALINQGIKTLRISSNDKIIEKLTNYFRDVGQQQTTGFGSRG